MRWVRVEEIYADGTHNAWPDLCYWQGRYYVVFPSHGKGHGGAHSVVILSSPDQYSWETVLDIPHTEWQIEKDETWAAETLFFLPTDERLYVVFWTRARGNADIQPQKEALLRKRWRDLGGSNTSWQRWVTLHEQSYRSGLTYTEDGRHWEKPIPLLEPGWWPWRPHTHDNRHYMIGFRCHAQHTWEFSPELETMIPRADDIAPLDPRMGQGMELFQSASMFISDDGLSWRKLSDIANNDDDEPDFNFDPGGKIVAVSRNGAANKHAVAYLSDPPYDQWKTVWLDRMIHQPAVLHHCGHWIVGGRYLDENTLEPNRFAPDKSFMARNGTRLWFFDDTAGTLTAGTTLPSWGDCGQPALLPLDNGDLLVAYYSCSQMIDENLLVGGGPHPGKVSPCSIYLARVVIDG